MPEGIRQGFRVAGELQNKETGCGLDLHLLLSLSIPVVFLGFAGMIKSLIKREVFWSNFYLGVDLALASLANGIINVVDLGSTLATLGSAEAARFSFRMYYNAVALVAAFGVLLLTMWLHQRLETLPEDFDGRKWRRGIWLGVVANLFGAASMSLFIIGRLKGKL